VDGGSFEVPSIPVASVADTTGAGDAFAAGFLGHAEWSADLAGAAAAGHAAAHELLVERSAGR
ncbi:MAG: PfkB family carbohydrate kinase, partial [Ilumatobacter fluminis]